MTVRGEDHAGDPAVTEEMTSPFIRHLGVELTEVSGDVVVARGQVRLQNLYQDA